MLVSPIRYVCEILAILMAGLNFPSLLKVSLELEYIKGITIYTHEYFTLPIHQSIATLHVHLGSQGTSQSHKK